MKKITSIVLFFLVAFSSLAACVRQDDEELSESMIKYNAARLIYINRISNGQYESIDEALKQTIKKYKKSDSIEDLLVIVEIVAEAEYKKYVVKYYGELFERVQKGEEFDKAVLTSEGIYYLQRLRAEKRTKKYKNFYENLNKYFDPNLYMFIVLLWFRDDIEEFTDKEKRYHLEVLLDYLEKFEDEAHLMFIGATYSTIADLYESLGEQELSVYYEDLSDEVTRRLREEFSDN